MNSYINEGARLFNDKTATEEASMFGARHFFGKRSLCVWLTLLATAMVMTQSGSVKADMKDAKFFTITQENIQKAETYFKFQSRVSQGKIPLGDVNFPILVVAINNGVKTVCTEKFSNVKVTDSVLNLEIGRGTSKTCNLESIVAANKDLSFQICFDEQMTNCLKAISFASVPYAVKSNYAITANKANTANEAVQCHYAHRATADRDLFTTQDVTIGKGYFDFYTPTLDYFENRAEADEMFWYQQTAQSIPGTPDYTKGGYIQWAGIDPNGNNLHICATRYNDINNDPIPLKELVMHADLSRFTGQLIVEGPQTLSGPGAIIKKGMDVYGRMIIWEEANFKSTVLFEKKVSIGRARSALPDKNEPPVFEVWGNATIHGNIGVDLPPNYTLADKSVTQSKLATDENNGTAAVASNNIQNYSVTEGKLANNAVATRSLQNEAVTAGKIGPGAVTADKIITGAVTVDKIGSGAVTVDKIGTGAVTADKIGDSAVVTSKINNSAITSAKLATDGFVAVGTKLVRLFGAVATDNIQLLAVTTDKIAQNAITGEKIAQNAVTSEKIEDGTIQMVDLAVGSVTKSRIADSAVGTSELANSSITNAKLNITRTNFTLRESDWSGFSGIRNLGMQSTFAICLLTVVGYDSSCTVRIRNGNWELVGESRYVNSTIVRSSCGAMCF